MKEGGSDRMKDFDPLVPVFWLAGGLVGKLIVKFLF